VLQRWQTAGTSRVRGCEAVGGSPARAGPGGWRGCGGALPSVLLAAGRSGEVVCERRKKSYRPSASMGLWRLPVALAGRKEGFGE